MKRFKKFIAVLLGLFLIIISVTVFFGYPMLTILNGFSAKNMSSSVFLVNRDVEFTDTNDNGFIPVNWVDDELDRKTKTSKASIFGIEERKAVFREGLGSVLMNEDYNSEKTILIPNRKKIKQQLPYPYGYLPQKDTVFNNVDYNKVKSIIDNAFDKENESSKQTRAVLVLYKDQIIAEKYIEELNKDSKLLGWSMTKSVLATIFGILEKKGTFSIKDEVPIVEWQNDKRRNITIKNLLEMNCGLDWEEDYFSVSDATKMLYLEADMTKSQIDKKAIYRPNERWYYSSGVTNLLSGVLRKHFNNYQEYLDFPYRELIDKIGMHSMLMETDLAGNYVGSSYGWATARDWAKFGLLYLHKGNWNGEQIFNPEWADYVSTPTPTSNGRYGAHFWLNVEGRHPDIPKDTFSANGFQGQRIFIIPSKDLVIVRFGLNSFGGFDFNNFVKEIVRSIS